MSGKERRLALLAYVLVCTMWGSTYLAIRIGVQHLPPVLFAAVRFLLAGGLLLAITRVARQPLPREVGDWITNLVAGVLMLGVAAGMVFWSEQFVGSGITAIIIVTVSLWISLFDAIVPGSRGRVTWIQGLGLLAGLAGTVVLMGTDLEELRNADWRGPVALTVGSAVWAIGSIWLQRRPRTASPYVGSAIQMLAGGVFLLTVGTSIGEWARWSFSWPGVASIAYLAVFGSIVGFTAYVYVLRHWPATIAGTYVYVNTVVAVALGWLILSEPVTGRTLFSMAVIMAAVLWVKAAGRTSTPTVPSNRSEDHGRVRKAPDQRSEPDSGRLESPGEAPAKVAHVRAS